MVSLFNENREYEQDGSWVIPFIQSALIFLSIIKAIF